MRFSFTYFVPDHFYYSLIQLDSNKLNQQKPDWFVEPKSIFNLKQIAYERKSNKSCLLGI